MTRVKTRKPAAVWPSDPEQFHADGRRVLVAAKALAEAIERLLADHRPADPEDYLAVIGFPGAGASGEIGDDRDRDAVYFAGNALGAARTLVNDFSGFARHRRNDRD